MKIDLVLEPLERILKLESNSLIPRKYILPTRLHIIKNYVMEIWYRDDKETKCLLAVSRNYRITNKEEKDIAETKLLKETIEVLLKLYIK